MFRRKLAFLDCTLQIIFGVSFRFVVFELRGLQDLLQIHFVLTGSGVDGFGYGFGHLHFVGISWFQARQSQSKSSCGHQWIYDRIIVVSIVVGQPYWNISCFVFSMENVEWAGPIFRCKNLNGAIEELANGLYFRIVSVDAILAGPCNVL